MKPSILPGRSALPVTYWLWSIPPDVYPAALRTGTLALRRQGRRALEAVRPGDRIFAYLSGRQVVTGLFEAIGEPFEDATALAPGRHLPHRLRVRSVAVLPEETWVPRESLGELRVLDEYADLEAGARFRRVVQQVLHRLPPIDGKVLEFVIRARLGADPDALLAAVEAVREARRREPSSRSAPAVVADAPETYGVSFGRARALEDVITFVDARGFQFEPWQVAAYVTALRTKPFVLLAGVTGVGKSKLPVLVAQATGGIATVLPVRPDWTDPAETLGYTDLEGRFRPGAVLREAREADGSACHHALVLDEMNLGRPEHYLADVLSKMEQRAATESGFASPPLLSKAAGVGDEWARVGLPPALGIVGTVNVDESAHAFSRKVLDRAFVLELAARDLRTWQDAAGDVSPRSWPLSAWRPRAIRLGDLEDVTEAERAALEDAVEAVADASAILAPAGLEVGYRARDEVALFVLHAAETPDAFRTSDGAPVDPLDLTLLMKVVPRIDGARSAVRDATAALLVWASGRRTARHALEDWQREGRTGALEGARFPCTAARLARVLEGADEDGVASFWA